MDYSDLIPDLFNKDKFLFQNVSSNLLSNITTTAEPEYPLLFKAYASVEILTILSIFYGSISFIAVIGNTLVIWIVATTRQMHTVTNMYIANLAFADVIIGIFCIPFQFQAALLQEWNLPEIMCAFCPFIQILSVNVSVFTLTAIAVDRHRAIINPLRARPTKFVSKIIIAAIWVVSISFATPIAIALRVATETFKIKENDIISNVSRQFCRNENLSDDQLLSYRYSLVLVQYVIPFCVISFVYMQMAVKLWGSRTPGNAQDARDLTLLKNKKKVIKMLIIVVVIFGLCWLPLQTYNILYVTWEDVDEYRYITIIWFCCDWLAMSNSCYNPFIYGIYNEKFRREFHKRFSFCFCRPNNQNSSDRTTSVYTRASSIRSNYTNSSTRTRYRNNAVMQFQQHQQLQQLQNQQQRETIAKSTEGYSAITELEHQKKDVGMMMNNNAPFVKNGGKSFWRRNSGNNGGNGTGSMSSFGGVGGGNVTDTVISNDYTPNIIVDCVCTPLDQNEWLNRRNCSSDSDCTDGQFLSDDGQSQINSTVTIEDTASNMLLSHQSSDLDKMHLIRIHDFTADNGGMNQHGHFINVNGINRNAKDIEMSEYCLLDRSYGRVQEKRNSVTFNNL